MPRTIDDKKFDPLVDEVQETGGALPWVRESRLRLREEGRFLTGTVYVVPREGPVSPERIEATEAQLLDLHWRLHDVSIMPRVEIEDPPTGGADDDDPPPLRAGALRRAALSPAEAARKTAGQP